MGAISLGAYFTPWLGTRVQAKAWKWDEDFLDTDGTYETKQYGGDLDLLLNITGMIFPHRNNLLNVVLIGGVGMEYSKFSASPTSHPFPLNMRGNRWTRNARLGGQLDLSLHRMFGIQLEGGYDLMHDHVSNFKHEKWWPYLMAGLNFKFGHKKAFKTTPMTTPVVQETTDNFTAEVAPAQPLVEEKKPEPKIEPEPKPEPKPVVAKIPEKQTDNVFFTIGRYIVGSEQLKVVEQIAQWAKEHPTATIQLTGYADRGTGNERVNQAISERRAASVKDALVKRGISASRITTDAKGDTVQPFNENDRNRAVVAVSEEK
jgi:outer membrane protein OmpA-like peptidoglycan-associated protein